ncbi:MAG: leucine--tRNA ligase [Pseudomonadota bacterium]
MDQRDYNPSQIETKWQKKWDEEKLFAVEEGDPDKKYYMLEMLPYPSGRLHMGHVRNYTIGDVAARFRMMQGWSVLHPIGWDAFGMPAENAAIERKVHPAEWTHKCIDNMRNQLKRLGYTYDWRREFATCDPDYYKWEQLVFLKMYEKGWAYKKESLVNWCEKCDTVLANEQVVDGKCWRCDASVTMKSLSQWFFKTTDYAEELLNDIDDKLTGWPERVKIMQREWIGKSKGAVVEFEIEGESEKLEIFTTRPDTLYGVTFMSLSSEHPLAMKLAKKYGKEAEMLKFAERTSHIDHDKRITGEYEKEGLFTGAYAINPVDSERVPIYAANFVLMAYGTGAVMAVPAHDQRDFEFAKKYSLSIKVVIHPDGEKLDASTIEGAFEGSGVMVDSSHFSGLNSLEGIGAVTKYLEEKGWGKFKTTYRLRDWGLSRQRYWGAPIPIIYCDRCGVVEVPEDQLPVALPKDVEFTGEGGNPLNKVESFVNVKCPKCGESAKRETDTMDTFVESSWYLLRYASPHYEKAILDKKKAAYWLPVDQYVGGIEHAVGHLIYCRYYTKILRDLGYIDIDEPVKNLMTQGMVYKDGAKMSKSKGNVVDPDDMIDKYGADVTRLFILFAAPPVKDLEWSDKGVEGSSRFVQRIWRFVMDWKELSPKVAPDSEIEKIKHKTIKKVTDDIEGFHYNTAISALMEYTNFLYQMSADKTPKDAIEVLLALISPFAPHVADELWRYIGNEGYLIRHPWPEYDETKVVEESMLVIVQVNGKLRDKLTVSVDVSEDEIKEMALKSEHAKKFIEGKPPKKVIYVKGKLVNIVV